ncbi:hypothetical protein KUCAC02_033016, partial [Chaenocephalus aceratus]
ETSTVNPPAFQLERFCSLLLEMGLIDDKLSLVTEQRNAILAAWDAVEDHDKQQQKFNQLYRTHWGNTLYCRTKRHNLVDAAVIQRGSRTSPEKTTILKAYERIQHRFWWTIPFLCPLASSATPALSPPDYPLMQYVPTPSTAGTQSLKGRRDMIMPLSHPQTSLPPVSLPRPPTPRPLPSPSPSTATRAIAGPSTRSIVPAIAGRPILLATSTIARPVPSLFPGPILPASQPTPAIAGPSSMPLLPAIQATPSADVSVPTTLECIPSSWARSTLYKRKGMDEPSG